MSIVEKKNVRLIAARVVDAVLRGRSLADCLDPALQPLEDVRDRAFVQAVCYGVCRYYSRLQFLLNNLLKHPMQAKDSDVYCLLLVGLYQLSEMRVPPHAAVSETVNATEALKKPWARGFVNAIMREYLRHKNELTEKIKDNEEAYYLHPAWWIAEMKKDWPQHWQQILDANNAHPPMSLRVNQQKISREAYATPLAKQAVIITETKNGVILEPPVAVEVLPGFAEGEVSVQDGAAQLAAELLDLQAGQRVLDACSAPGGKLLHILETEPKLSTVIAVEKDKARLAAINENLARHQFTATVINQDAANTSKWWDGELFDRILLDAPCSASGVIRRHPDIKLLRKANDIKALVKEQQHLLTTLWPLLKPGGILLYATCSIFPAENALLLQTFLSAHPDAAEDKIQADWGLPCPVGRQILPGMHNMDGFFYARLRKQV